MADILASLAVAIGAETSGLTKGIAIAKKELRGLVNFGASLQDIGKNLTIGLTAPLGLLAGAAIQASGELDGLRRGLSLYVGEGQKLTAELTKLKEVAKLPGLGLKEAIQGSTNLQAAGFSADFARRALVGFGSALASVGKGKQELDRVSLALTQINNTPFVQGQDLNQLRQALPQIGAVMKKVFGVTTVEALKEAGISSKQFIEGVTAEFERLPKATGGLKNSLENLSDASTIALDAVGSALDRVFNVQGAADGVYNLATGFAALPPSVQNTTVALGGLAAALGPTLVGIGALAKATPLLANGFALLTSPVGLTVAVLAGGAALIIANWDKVSAYFTTGDGAGAFKELKAVATEAFSAIRSLSAVVTDALRDNWGTVATVVGGALRGVLGVATLALQSLRGAVQGISGLAKGDLSEAGVGFKALAASMVGVVVPAETAADKLGRLNVRIKELSADLQANKDFLKARLATGGTLDGSSELLANIANQTKQLNALTAQRRELFQAEREGLGPQELSIALTAEQSAITSELSGATNKQSDALARLQAEIRSNLTLGNALGSEFDFVAKQAATLQSGIESLIKAGWEPQGKVVQGFIGQLKELRERQALYTAELIGTQAAIKGGGAIQGGVDTSAAAIDPNAGRTLTVGALPTKLPALDTKDYSKSLEDARQNTLDFSGAITGAFVTLGETIGAAFSGVDVNFGSVLLGVLGKMASQVGQAAIAIGVGMLNIKAAFSNPFSAIAAGVALVAVGAALSSAASASNVIGGGGGGYSAPSVGGYQSPRPATQSTYKAGDITRKVEFVLRGRDLVAVGDLYGAYTSRLNGG